jgi:hypothetical protein
MSSPRSLSKEVTSGFISLEKLNASNWWAWKTRIITLFTLYDYLKYIDGSFKIPAPASPSAPTVTESKAITDWETEDLHARHLLQTALGDSELIHLQGATDAAEAWNQLKEIHEPKGLTAIVDAVWKLYDTRCHEGSSVTEHVTTLRSLLQEISTLGQIIPDSQFAMICTKSLPRSWDQWTSSFWAGQSDITKIKSSEVISRIMEEDRRRKSRVDVDKVANLAAHN